jgi:predicted CXXCH cytochrome family protein
MNVLISFLTRKSTGDVVHRDEEMSAEVLRLGRATDSEVHLADPRILLSHAAIHSRPAGFFIESIGSGSLIVNEQVTNSARIGVGDRMRVGPYEVVVVQAPAGKDLALTVELVEPFGNALAELEARSRTSLAAGGMSKRAWSWTLLLAVLVLFLALPVAGFFVPQVKAVTTRYLAFVSDKAWDSGEISTPHKFFGDDCQRCHTVPFRQVKDNECLHCHSTVPHHVDVAKFQMAKLDEASCESCHKEHNGPKPITLRAQAFCSDCHGGLAKLASATTLKDTADFGTSHPQFRPTVMVDPVQRKWERISLDEKDKLKEKSGLKFPHDKHLVETGGGVRTPTGNRVMKCADCHQVEPGGELMKPIRMEQHCAECHKLNFTPAAPERVVPHARPHEVQEIIKDYYARAALEGGFTGDKVGEEIPDVVRRRPGTPITEEQRRDALAWAREKGKATTDQAFGISICGSCHVVAKDSNESWTIVGARIAYRWLAKSKFNHDKHATMDCAGCHKAKESKTAEDVLLPGIDNCQECHGGQQASNKIPSTCVDCHYFHIPGVAPMREKSGGPAKSASLFGDVPHALGRRAEVR